MNTIDLYAAGTDELLASVPLPGAAFANPEARLVGGLVVPWNVVGMPSTGRTRFRPNSVTPPPTKSWAKLLIEHDTNQSVGTLANDSESAGGLLASLRVAEGPAGDAAIQGVISGTRDAFSVRVEVDDWAVIDDPAGKILEVRASRLREVSLVSVPAYDVARATLLASLPPSERESTMAKLNELLEIQASAPGVPAPPGTPVPGQGTPDTPPAPAPVPAPPAPAGPPAVQASAAPFDLTALAAALAPHLAGVVVQPGDTPAGPPNGAPSGARGIETIRAAAQAVVEWQNSGSGNPGVLMAALNDVVPANDAGGMTGVGTGARPQWLGELWTARKTQRPYVDALGTPKQLTGMKAKGWRWVTRAQVGDYAGNKAAIPSNAVSTEPAEANAHRVAGGWDVDRVFIDLGDAEMITSLFEAATEDYINKSNIFAKTALLAGAVANDADGLPAADVPSLLVALGAAAGALGAQVSFLAMAGDLWAEFAALTKDDIPWWMGSGDGMNLATGEGSAGGFKFWSDPTLAAGTYLGGDGRGATYYEQGATPIKVQALNIPNGGVDLGVFGYNAVIVNDQRTLFHGTVGA